MNKVTTYVGIDPSSKTNCCLVFDGITTVEHSIINEYAPLLAFFQTLTVPSIIGIEATGSYSERALHAAASCGHIVKRLSNSRIKNYSAALGHKNKTDSVDAGVILEFTMKMHNNLPDFVPICPEKKALLLKTQLLEKLEKEKRANLNQLHSLRFMVDVPKEILMEYEQIDSEIQIKIDRLTQSIDKDVESTMAEEIELLDSIPGIGKKTAKYVLTYIGDFSQAESAKHVASYLGVTPTIEQSGKRTLKKGIGRTSLPTIRSMMYVCAWSASRYNVHCESLYKRLLNKGKSKKAAMLAVVHMLVRQMYGVLKSKTIFVNEIKLKPVPA